VPRHDLALRSVIETIAAEYPRYGEWRISAELRRREWAVKGKRVQWLMREENLLVAVKRSCRTTDSTHSDRHYAKVLRNLAIVCPDQVWCTDLRYIPGLASSPPIILAPNPPRTRSAQDRLG
jgi:putative transposase